MPGPHTERPRGQCRSCRTTQPLRRNGTVHGHPGWGLNRCPGGGLPPLEGPPPSATQLVERLEKLPTRVVDGRAMVDANDIRAVIDGILDASGDPQ